VTDFEAIKHSLGSPNRITPLNSPAKQGEGDVFGDSLMGNQIQFLTAVRACSCIWPSSATSEIRVTESC
jgi:hypothetical protein